MYVCMYVFTVENNGFRLTRQRTINPLNNINPLEYYVYNNIIPFAYMTDPTDPTDPTIKHLVISSGGPAGHMMYSILRTLNIKGVFFCIYS